MYLKRMEPLPEKQAAMDAHSHRKLPARCHWWRAKAWQVLKDNREQAIAFPKTPMILFTLNDDELTQLLKSGLYRFALDGKKKITAKKAVVQKLA